MAYSKRRGRSDGNVNIRGSGVQGIAKLLGSGLRGLQIEQKIKEHTAPLVWAEVVGAQVAGSTQILGVADGVLRVSTKSAVWANELSFYKTDILKRLNLKLSGTPSPPYVIKDIHFVNRGLTEPEPEPASRTAIPKPTTDELDDVALSSDDHATIDASVAAVSDDGLREKLRKLRGTDTRLKLWRMENGWMPCETCGTMSPPRLDREGNARFGEPDCPRCRVLLRSTGQW
ncbi:MAG: DUF721 domain-containing protein [Armatimonadetes bacterium]|nr:DUF721 domain-containing protein [Armatimonadota bacterium]